ncbi:MAG: hypothetical protein ACK4VY_01100 [Brevundimonas sp.]
MLPSADVPHTLQFQTFSQVATLSTAGAGLAITLAGSILSDFKLPIWIAVLCFSLSALISLVAQVAGVEAMFLRRPSRAMLRNYALGAVTFMAVGIGALGSGVFLAGL